MLDRFHVECGRRDIASPSIASSTFSLNRSRKYILMFPRPRCEAASTIVRLCDYFCITLSRYLPESAYIRLLTNSVSWGFHLFARVRPSRRCTWRWGSTLLENQSSIGYSSLSFPVVLRPPFGLHCPPTLPFSSSTRCSTSFRYFT